MQYRERLGYTTLSAVAACAGIRLDQLGVEDGGAARGSSEAASTAASSSSFAAEPTVPDRTSAVF